MSEPFDRSSTSDRALQHGWQLISSAPFDVDLELAVTDRQGATHPLAFACRRVADGWLNAETNDRVDLHATHWREWRAPRYGVRIARQGAEGFGWEICRIADSVVLQRCTRLFATRIEAIFDSARAAEALKIAIIQPSLAEGEGHDGCN